MKSSWPVIAPQTTRAQRTGLHGEQNHHLFEFGDRALHRDRRGVTAAGTRCSNQQRGPAFFLRDRRPSRGGTAADFEADFARAHDPMVMAQPPICMFDDDKNNLY